MKYEITVRKLNTDTGKTNGFLIAFQRVIKYQFDRRFISVYIFTPGRILINGGQRCVFEIYRKFTLLIAYRLFLGLIGQF